MGATTLAAVTTILVATDADWVFNEVAASVSDADTHVERVRAGAEVLGAVHELDPDLIVLDLQIGNMGGMATCLQLHGEDGAGRIAVGPILMLLDRAADVFLARRSEADGWLVKPLDGFRIRRAVDALLDGGTWHESALAG